MKERTQGNTRMTDVGQQSATIKIEDVPVKRHSVNSRPASLDLSSVVTPPVNQGLCGSCWAISTSQCLRDRINRVRKEPIPLLSFQFIIDCSRHCVSFQGRHGCALSCNGGFLATSFKFLQDVGTPRENFHPNRHVDERGEDHIDGTSGSAAACPSKVDPAEPMYKCDGFYNVHVFLDTFGITNARMKPKHKTPQQLQANAANIAEEIFRNGPVAVCFNLFSDFRTFWSHPQSASMVYEIGWQLPREVRESGEIDPVGSVDWTQANGPYGIHFKTGHSVSIVGYGTQQVEGRSIDYWICRNSWGSSGHNKGFFKIRRGVNASAIEGDVGAPLVRAASAALYAAQAPILASPSTQLLSAASAASAKSCKFAWIVIAMLVMLAAAVIYLK